MGSELKREVEVTDPRDFTLRDVSVDFVDLVGNTISSIRIKEDYGVEQALLNAPRHAVGFKRFQVLEGNITFSNHKERVVSHEFARGITPLNPTHYFPKK